MCVCVCVCVRARARALIFYFYTFTIFDLNYSVSFDNEDCKSSESLSIKYKAKLCEITGQVIGITFKDVDRKWLHDDVYIYIAKIVTKTISFDVKLTVTVKVCRKDHNSIISSIYFLFLFLFTYIIFFQDLNDFKIEDITCYFIDVHDCHMLEISPWFQKIANMKNFSLLMSGE